MISIHSPKVNQILSLGENMTTRHIQYLLKREVNHDEIAQALNMSPYEFKALLLEMKASTRKNNAGRKQKVTLTAHEYFKLCSKYLKDKEVAKAKGISLHTLSKWKSDHKEELILILGKADLNQLLFLAKHTSYRNLALLEFERRGIDHGVK